METTDWNTLITPILTELITFQSKPSTVDVLEGIDKVCLDQGNTDMWECRCSWTAQQAANWNSNPLWTIMGEVQTLNSPNADQIRPTSQCNYPSHSFITYLIQQKDTTFCNYFIVPYPPSPLSVAGMPVEALTLLIVHLL